MNDKGFIVLWRKMIESWVWCLSDADFRLAVTCLVIANWKEGKWFDGKEMIPIDRGSFVTTIQKLKSTLGNESTEKKIRGGLKRLAAAEFLCWGQGKGKRYTHITILNYSQYQDIQDGAAVEKQLKGQESAVDMAVERQSRGSREAVERATIEPLNKETKKQESTGKSKNGSNPAALALASRAVTVLNSLLGKTYSATSVATVEDCAKLAKAGYTAADVEAVCRAKHREWANDRKMAIQIKPSVLLRKSNFRKYLDEDVSAGTAEPPRVIQDVDLESVFADMEAQR